MLSFQNAKHLKIGPVLLLSALLTQASISLASAAPVPSPTPLLDHPHAQAPRTPMPEGIEFEERRENGATTIWAKWDGGEQKIADTMILPKGTLSYHWAPIDVHEIVAATRGLVGPEYKKNWDVSVSTYNAQGPGLYASLSPLDSASYGVKVLQIEATHDLTLAFSSRRLHPSRHHRIVVVSEIGLRH